MTDIENKQIYLDKANEIVNSFKAMNSVLFELTKKEIAEHIYLSAAKICMKHIIDCQDAGTGNLHNIEYYKGIEKEIKK